VLLDCSGNSRVRELEQQRAAGARKYRRLAIDAPGRRLRTEYAGERTGRASAQRIQLALEAFRNNDVERIVLCVTNRSLAVSTGCSTRKSN
jgi:hypothetical protein